MVKIIKNIYFRTLLLGKSELTFIFVVHLLNVYVLLGLIQIVLTL